jgi:hypothetical protein
VPLVKRNTNSDVKKSKEMIQKVNVTSPKAFNYLRSLLCFGSSFLSKYILEFPLEQGKVFAFVPEETSNEALFQFESGGLYAANRTLLINSTVVPIQNEGKSFIVNIVREFLKMDTGNCCMFEEPNAKPSDPFIKNSGHGYIHIKDEIFYFINNGNNSVEEIENILTKSEAHYLLGVLSSLECTFHKNFSPFSEIKPELLRIIVQNIEKFFSIAYDHEGYLMWSLTE